MYELCTVQNGPPSATLTKSLLEVFKGHDIAGCLMKQAVNASSQLPRR